MFDIIVIITNSGESTGQENGGIVRRMKIVAKKYFRGLAFAFIPLVKSYFNPKTSVD